MYTYVGQCIFFMRTRISSVNASNNQDSLDRLSISVTPGNIGSKLICQDDNDISLSSLQEHSRKHPLFSDNEILLASTDENDHGGEEDISSSSESNPSKKPKLDPEIWHLFQTLHWSVCSLTAQKLP